MALDVARSETHMSPPTPTHPIPQCCADSSKSIIGQSINGGCYAYPFCPIFYSSPGGTTSGTIIGKNCPSNPTVCSECW